MPAGLTSTAWLLVSRPPANVSMSAPDVDMLGGRCGPAAGALIGWRGTILSEEDGERLGDDDDKPLGSEPIGIDDLTQ